VESKTIQKDSYDLLCELFEGIEDKGTIPDSCELTLTTTWKTLRDAKELLEDNASSVEDVPDLMGATSFELQSHEIEMKRCLDYYSLIYSTASKV